MHEPAGSGRVNDPPATESGSSRSTCAGRIARLLRDGGLHAALAYLNERTRYRFTGLYRVEPPLLRNIGLFDRENPGIDVSGGVTRLEESYCSLTSSAAAPFMVQDAQSDERLVMHAARDSVLCYVGVPIRLPGGQPWGTLCHFDLRPRLLVTDELGALTTVAPVLTEWLASHPGIWLL